MVTGSLESKHMKDAVGCLLNALEKTYPVFKKCFETGVVDFKTEAPATDAVVTGYTVKMSPP